MAPRPATARRTGLLLILFGSLVSALPPAEFSESSPPAKIRIVELSGTPYEMGRIHGRTLGPEIRELVKRWKENLTETFGVPPEAFIRRLLEKTDFKAAMARWTPGLLEEVRGIADGAGVDFDTMYAFQLIDEIWAMGADLGFSKCTTIGARKRGAQPAFVAQTLDIPGFYHGFQTVLRIKDEREGLESLVFTIPGVVAANGLNSRSVGVCVNAVTQLAYSPMGLPVDFVVRGILRQKSFDEAVEFLRNIRPAAPQNYVIGGPETVSSFERSADKISEFLPFAGAEFTFHTNHPLVNDDLNPGFLESLALQGMTMKTYRARCRRFDFLGRTLEDNHAVIDLSRLKTLFQNRHSGINNPTTYGCTIMVLGENPELHISPGRPDEAPFEVLRFEPRSEK